MYPRRRYGAGPEEATMAVDWRSTAIKVSLEKQCSTDYVEREIGGAFHMSLVIRCRECG